MAGSAPSPNFKLQEAHGARPRIRKSIYEGRPDKKVLPVLDDLERAMLNVPTGRLANVSSWSHASCTPYWKRKPGSHRSERRGIRSQFHEAISYESVEGVESGHIIAIARMDICWRPRYTAGPGESGEITTRRLNIGPFNFQRRTYSHG